MDPTTSTQVNTSSGSLRAWPAKSSAAPPLSTLIERINTQRRGFRHVTEQSLEDEMAAQERGQQVDGDSSESEDEEDEKSAKEQLYEAKAELQKFAGHAFNESAMTLDFLSLLLTRNNVKQAEMTLSPYVKSHAPLGSLGGEVVQAQKTSEQTERQNSLVATGWKLKSLSSSADSLLRAASSLEKEMEKETKYWEQVMAVKAKGWSVCRLPREKQTLGVRYGFLEAAPEFRDKGLAALRRDEDGSIDLDLGVSSTPRSISVQLRKDHDIVAVSRPEDLFLDGDRSAERAILQARNNLFDEELFHEMYREARTMGNRGVKCVRNGISVPLSSDLTMFIELENTSKLRNGPAKHDGIHAQYAQLAVTALRILLAHSHRQNYLRKSKLQPPITEKKSQRPIPPILRPILSFFEHKRSMSAIQTFIQDMERILKAAGLPVDSQKPETNLKMDNTSTTPDNPDSTRSEDRLTSMFLAPLVSSLKVQVGDEDLEFTTSIRTHSMGTDYKFISEPITGASFRSQIPTELTFSTAQELQYHISHMIMLWLVDAIERRQQIWHASAPDEGELLTQQGLDGNYQSLAVTLDSDALGLIWFSTFETGEEMSIEWRKGENDAELPSFMAKVDEFSNMVSQP